VMGTQSYLIASRMNRLLKGHSSGDTGEQVSEQVEE